MLIKRLYEKDISVYEDLMKSYNKLLWVIAAGILMNVGSIEDIEDCISEVYTKLWENPKLYDEKKGSLKTFLSVMVKNRALDKYRKLTRLKIIELNDATHKSNDDLLEYIINKEKYKELFEAINTLKEPDKEIMIRRYFFDEKPSKIAKKFSIPVKDVENKLYQNKARIKKLICS